MLHSHSIVHKLKSCRRPGETDEKVKGHVVPQSARGKAAKIIENRIKPFYDDPAMRAYYSHYSRLLQSALELT